MDAKYLNSTVSDGLTQGFAALARLQPDDPIDYLGKWLIKHADSLAKSKESHETSASGVTPGSGAAAARAALAAKPPAAAPAESAHADSRTRSEGVAAAIAELAACTEVDAAVLSKVANSLRDVVRATGVYFAEKVAPKAPAGEEGGPASVIRYVAASSGQDFMLDAVVKEGEGATWKCWVRPEVPEEEEGGGDAGEEGEEGVTRPPRPAPQLPTVHIPNVLRSSDVAFLRLPKPGAFVAVPVEYGCLLHDAALPPLADPALAIAVEAGEGAEGGDAEAEGKGEGEEGGEGHAAASAAGAGARSPAVPPGNAVPRLLALCADTLGQNRDFSPEQVASLQAVAAALKAACERTEAAAYRAEYSAAKAALQSAGITASSALSEQQEVQADAEAQVAAALGELPEGAAEEHRADAKAAATWRAHREWLQRRSQALLAAAARRIAPKAEVPAVLQQAWFLAGSRREELGDPRSPDPAAFDWATARQKLTPHFVDRLLALETSAPAGAAASAAPAAAVASYQRPDALRAALAAVPAESLAPEGSAFIALHSFVLSTLDARDAHAARARKQAEEVAEAKARAEEEARAKAAADAEAAEAAAAAAAAAAEGGDEAAAEGGEE